MLRMERLNTYARDEPLHDSARTTPAANLPARRASKRDAGLGIPGFWRQKYDATLCGSHPMISHDFAVGRAQKRFVPECAGNSPQYHACSP